MALRVRRKVIIIKLLQFTIHNVMY
jgi:hypothetical protein